MEIVYLLIATLAFSAAIARTMRARGALLTWLALIAIVFFAVHVAAEATGWDGTTYRDYLNFWKAGNDVRAGREAYSASFAQNYPFLNPPTILPLLVALASLPAAPSFAVWTIFNGLLVSALLPLCRKALASERSLAVAGLDTTTVLTLTAAVALSNATRANLINGQMGILVAFAMILAYWARGAHKLFLSAALLTVATIKINLMLPFAMIFLRRRYLPVWIWTPVLVMAMCLTTAGVAQQWSRAKTLAGKIEGTIAAGEMNDYSRAGPHPADILGFDKLFYHLGFSDRSVIRVLQLAALLLLGLGLGAVALQARTPPGLLASMLALYAVVFLYHRNYDTLILGLPLAFAAGHARTSKTVARWWMSGAALAILSVMYVPRKALFLLMHHQFQSALLAGFVEWIVLPSATWLVLVSMACLWVGSRKLQDNPEPAQKLQPADSICS